jgi:hypothetical protein
MACYAEIEKKTVKILSALAERIKSDPDLRSDSSD